MSQSIALAKAYVPLLDEVYKKASKTAVLDGAPELVKAGANANELIIPKMSLQGLGAYSRNGGYVNGDVTITNETVTCNFDRGRMFSVDSMDDIETAGVAFGQLSAEFIRTKVVPELDAFRIAKYCSAASDNVTAASGAYSTGAGVISAIAAKYDAMTDAEVPEESRYLFITSTNLGLIRDAATTTSKELLDKFAGVIVMPQSRFYTAITQKDGSTSGQEAGGYVAATGSYDLQFLIIEKSAVIQFDKHVAPKIVTPDQNQNADAWKFGYRNVSIADAYDNKIAGIAGEYAGNAHS